MNTRPMSVGSKLAILALVVLAVGVALMALVSAYAGALGASYMDSSPERNIETAPGTGSAGSSADHAAIWSGPVECEWSTDGWTTVAAVEDVVGFDVPVTDAAFVPSRDPFDGTVTHLDLLEGEGWAELGMYSRQNFDLELAMSVDGRNGTAATVGGEMVFAWSCTDGP